MKRSPIQRRTPLRPKRKEPGGEREPRPMALSPASRRGSYSGGVSGEAVSKENVSQSPAYMRAAKALGYCMLCRCQVVPLTGQLDFCHADQGKGQGIKTDVRRGWPGCRSCHNAVGREMSKPDRRLTEDRLGAETRAAITAAGLWPANLPKWEEA